MTESTDLYAAIGVTSVAFVPPSPSNMTDTELLHAQRTLAEIRRRHDASSAVVAGAIAHRSRPELGGEGLAQKLGARTPEILVQRLTESTAEEARAVVRVGRIVETETASSQHAAAVDEFPWLREVAAAVVAGRLSVARADVIRAGLGSVDSASADAAALLAGLSEAAVVLLRESPSLTVERLAARARALRADLDDERVHEREQHLRDRRYLHLFAQADGMTRVSGLLDPESAALVTSAFDAATSPRRAGPRFVDPAEQARAVELAADDRTVEQIMADTFVQLIRIAGEGDSSRILGSRRPAVRVLVAERDLTEGTGRGFLEGQTEPISIQSVRRHICASGIVPILFDDSGQPMRMGRKSRLFTSAQRVALAARDGGCRFPGCDRPPSWTEAHHPDEWERDRGKTDIENGILLCQHHHLLMHNHGWRVTRTGTEYFVVPPASIDPHQRPLPAPSRSEALRRLAS